MTVNEDVQIADFATAKRQAEITGFQIVGTDIYMAPEVYDCLPYSLSSDMYSIGVMMWEIWNRKRSEIALHTDYNKILHSGYSNRSLMVLVDNSGKILLKDA